jgi:hypothetical protein
LGENTKLNFLQENLLMNFDKTGILELHKTRRDLMQQLEKVGQELEKVGHRDLMLAIDKLVK